MPANNLGLCCHYVRPSKRPGEYENLLKVNVLQLGRFRTGKYPASVVKATWIDTLDRLLSTLPLVFRRHKVYRFPSGILPLFDQLPRQTYESDADIVSRFEAIGRLVREHDVRATFHPGQFCSLSSDSPSTVRQAVAELDHHAWQFDCMGLPATPFHAINIHGGKSDRSDNLKHVVNTQLSSTARARLTFENDESCYSVADLLDIWKSTGVPVLFDSHHHTFNDAGLPMDLASRAAKATWGDVRPLQHISNSEPTLAPNASFTKLRAHSEYIHHIPQVQLDDVRAGAIDLEVEAKLKNLAIDRMIQSFDFVSKSTHSVMNTTPGVQ